MTGSQAGERILAIVDRIEGRLLAMRENQAGEPPSAGKWSPKEVLGHLIDSAANNHQRFIRGQLEKELVFPGYKQTDWVSLQGYAEEKWRDIVGLWAGLNRHLAHVVARIPPDKMETPCRIGGGSPVTFGYILDDYVRHVEHHLEQIRS